MNNQSPSSSREVPELPESPDTLEELNLAALAGALGAIPVVGSVLSGVFETAMRVGNAKKAHMVLKYLLEEVTELKMAQQLNAENLIGDEQFVAYVNRAIRASLETGEKDKVKALSIAAAHSGKWNPIRDAEREFYWRLIVQYNALHFQTLRVLHLGRHPNFASDVKIVLDDFFRLEIGFPAHHEDIGRATLSDLYKDGLVPNDLGLGFSLSPGVSQLSTLGGDFLNFISEAEVSAR